MSCRVFVREKVLARRRGRKAQREGPRPCSSGRAQRKAAALASLLASLRGGFPPVSPPLALRLPRVVQRVSWFSFEGAGVPERLLCLGESLGGARAAGAKLLQVPTPGQVATSRGRRA